MKKTFEIPKDYEKYNDYFKDKYPKPMYDMILCELLELRYKAVDNKIDIKLLMNTIIDLDANMGVLLSVIYQAFDQSSRGKKVEALDKKENEGENIREIKDKEYSGLADTDIDFST